MRFLTLNDDSCMLLSINKIVGFIKQHWLTLTVLMLSVITFLSLSPLDELPTVPGTDKTHHVIAYALLMLPTILKRHQHWLWIGIFFIAYSGMIELVQPYVNRYGEWLDMLANTSGIVLAVLIGKLFNR